MIIGKSKLRQIITEEVESVLSEMAGGDIVRYAGPYGGVYREIGAVLDKAGSIWGKPLDGKVDREAGTSTMEYAEKLTKQIIDRYIENKMPIERLISLLDQAMPKYVAFKLCQKFDGGTQKKCADRYIDR